MNRTDKEDETMYTDTTKPNSQDLDFDAAGAAHYGAPEWDALTTERAAHEAAHAERTFGVFSWHQDHIERTLTALAKRAARKGLTPVAWAWGKAYSDIAYRPTSDGDAKRERVTRIPLTITGAAPHYAGWRFLAALEHLDGENIVRAVLGAEVPPTYRHAAATCEHCHAARRRANTYVLGHVDGRLAQVGSSCIDDFLGTDAAGKLAGAATYFADVCACAEEGLGWGTATRATPTVGEYLAFVAHCVRESGWVSRTAAGDFPERAAANVAAARLANPNLPDHPEWHPAQEDADMAAAAEAWAEALTDAQVDAERGDYLHNVRAAVRTGLATPKRLGILASVVIAYQRAVGRERARAASAAAPRANEHVGTVGARTTWTGLVLDFVTGYETDYGYTTVLKFRGPGGACLVWKASSTDIARGDVGKAYDVTGTVKAHDEYKGAKQTILSRCVCEPAKGDGPPAEVAVPAKVKRARGAKAAP